MRPVSARCAAFFLGVCLSAPGQVIEFESKGLKYQTLTKRGVTVMYAHLAAHMHEFSILQVAVSNGSPGPYTIRPEDFTFVRQDGEEIHGMIEWYDKYCLKVNRTGASNLLIYKPSIKYLYKESEAEPRK